MTVNDVDALEDLDIEQRNEKRTVLP